MNFYVTSFCLATLLLAACSTGQPLYIFTPGASSAASNDGTGGWTNTSTTTTTSLQTFIQSYSAYPGLTVDNFGGGASDPCFSVKYATTDIFYINCDGNAYSGNPSSLLVKASSDVTWIGTHIFAPAPTSYAGYTMQIETADPSAPSQNFTNLYAYNNSGAILLRYQLPNGSTINLEATPTPTVPAYGIFTVNGTAPFNNTANTPPLKINYSNNAAFSIDTNNKCVNVSTTITKMEVHWECLFTPVSYTTGTGNHLLANLYESSNSSAFTVITGSLGRFPITNSAGSYVTMGKTIYIENNKRNICIKLNAQTSHSGFKWDYTVDQCKIIIREVNV